MILACAILAFTITGGHYGTFFSPNGTESGEVLQADTPGNSASYFDYTYFSVVYDGVITRDDVVMTNVAMPRLVHNVTDDTFSWNCERSILPGERLLDQFTSPVDHFSYDISWRSQSDFGATNFFYYMKGTNTTVASHSTPHYSVIPRRSNQKLRKSILATCEANLERWFYASNGLSNNVVSVQTNADFVIVTNAYMSQRFLNGDILSQNQAYASDSRIPRWIEYYTTQDIYAYATSNTTYYIYSNVTHAVTNFVIGEHMDLKELLRARDDTLHRMYDPADYQSVTNLPGGITNNHWWSSSLLNDQLLPDLENWEHLGTEEDDPTRKCFDDSAPAFADYGTISSGAENYENAPIDRLIRLVQVDGEYNDVIVFPVTTNMSSTVQGSFPTIVTNWISEAYRSGGDSGIGKDVSDTWVTYTTRKIPMILCGVNQMLAMQDRTIHIPDFSYVCTNKCESIYGARDYELYQGALADVRWSNAENKWVASLPSSSWRVTFETNIYSQASNETALAIYNINQDMSFSGCVQGSTNVGIFVWSEGAVLNAIEGRADIISNIVTAVVTNISEYVETNVIDIVSNVVVDVSTTNIVAYTNLVTTAVTNTVDTYTNGMVIVDGVTNVYYSVYTNIVAHTNINPHVTISNIVVATSNDVVTTVTTNIHETTVRPAGISYLIEQELIGETVYAFIEFAGFQQFIYSDLSLTNALVPVTGNASFWEQDVYERTNPEMVGYCLGPTQPGVNAISDGIVTDNQLGILMNVVFLNGAKENVTNLVKTSIHEYDTRDEIYDKLKLGMQDVCDKLAEQCPITLHENKKVTFPAFKVDFDETDISFQADFPVQGTFLLYKEDGEYVVRHTFGDTNVTNDMPTAISFVKLNVNQSGDWDTDTTNGFYQAEGNLHPITQVDWNWNSMKLGN